MFNILLVHYHHLFVFGFKIYSIFCWFIIMIFLFLVFRYVQYLAGSLS